MTHRWVFIVLFISSCFPEVEGWPAIHGPRSLQIQSRQRRHSWNTIRPSALQEPEITENVSNDENSTLFSPLIERDDRFLLEAETLALAGIIGASSGATVGAFKLSIESVRQFSYNIEFLYLFLVLIPAIGGLAVALLRMPGPFSAGLLGTIEEVDHATQSGGAQNISFFTNFARKTAGSVMTLGTGSSLGPEGPSVELGLGVSRLSIALESMFGKAPVAVETAIARNRLLLSCGAAAGVSAGFNAPIAGVFFALEIMQRAFDSSSIKITRNAQNVTAILFASVLSALIGRAILGDHLVLSVSGYNLRTPLLELPLYLVLGIICGIVASLFSACAKLFTKVFAGEVGPDSVRMAIQQVPDFAKPIIGGLFCGVIGVYYPQTLFFGYETLNELLAKSGLPTEVSLSLLVWKTLSSALAAASGLVGGTFAPALFLGAMTGGAFHNILVEMFRALQESSSALELADIQAYAMVGAASVLAALFRAPLTASLLLFELTRDYDVILPLMVSAGLGSLVGDLIEEKVVQLEQQKERRDRDSVSWGDLSSK